MQDKTALNQKLEQKRHLESLQKLSQVERSLVRSVELLIKYLDGKTTKTEVVNQLDSIATPDVDKVVKALAGLDRTVVASRVDLSSLKEVISELKQIPKELPKIPEPLSKIEVTNQVDHSQHFEKLEKAIKELKLEAPKVAIKVPEAKVNVAPLDLKPLQTGLLQVVNAIQTQKFPESPKTNLSILENETKETNKQLDEANKSLKKIIEKPMGGGGGGGGSSFKNETGNIVYADTIAAGGKNVATIIDVPLTCRIDDTSTANTTYIGKATIGSATSGAVWQIAKLDTSSGLIKTWADANASFDNVWDDRVSLTYS